MCVKNLILLLFFGLIGGAALAHAGEECGLEWESSKGKNQLSEPVEIRWQPVRQGRAISGSIDSGAEVAVLNFQWLSDLDYSRLANPAQANQKVEIQLVRKPGDKVLASEWSFQQAVKEAGAGSWLEQREAEGESAWPIKLAAKEKAMGFRLICRGAK